MESKTLTRREALASLFALTIPIALIGCAGSEGGHPFRLRRSRIAAPVYGLGVFPLTIEAGIYTGSVSGSGIQTYPLGGDASGPHGSAVDIDLPFGIFDFAKYNEPTSLGLHTVSVSIEIANGNSDASDAQILVIPSDHKVGLLVDDKDSLSLTLGRSGGQAVKVDALAINDASYSEDTQIGFTGDVALAVAGQGDGVTATLNKTSLSLTPGNEATANVTIQVSATATPGVHELAVTGTHADGKVARAPIHLTVSGSAPSPSPSPSPTPTATPSPSPSPTPTPIPGGSGFTISSSTAPLTPGGFTANSGTATREEGGSILRIEINGSSGGIGRYLTIVIRDSMTIGPGHTYPIGGLPLDNGRATVSYQQSGGAPYYQNYIGRASAGTVRIESTSGGAWRVILSGAILEADPDSPASGSFHLDGAMEITPPAG